MTTTRVAGLSALLVALAFAAASGSVSASGSARASTGSLLAFVRQYGPSYSVIYVARQDGTRAHRLTPPLRRYQATDPEWSPDGSKIAYVLSGSAVVMNADGSGKRPLCNDHSDALVELTCTASGKTAPAWSPDGQRVAFGLFAAFSHDRGVAIVNADGADLRFVPGTAKFHVSGLDWSPDGRRLVIAASYLTPSEAPWDVTYRLWVVNVDGSGLRLLARDAGASPRWSPDGKTILFARHDGGGIYTVDARGGRRRLIRKTPGKNAFVWSATWSPDGTRIAFFENGAPGNHLHVLRLSDGLDRIVALQPPVCKGTGVGCFQVDWQGSREAT